MCLLRPPAESQAESQARGIEKRATSRPGPTHVPGEYWDPGALPWLRRGFHVRRGQQGDHGLCLPLPQSTSSENGGHQRKQLATVPTQVQSSTFLPKGSDFVCSRVWRSSDLKVTSRTVEVVLKESGSSDNGPGLHGRAGVQDGEGSPAGSEQVPNSASEAPL